MSAPTGQLPTLINRASDDTELALLEFQLLATQSTHQYLGSGRYGLSKSQDGYKGGNSFFTTFPRKRQFQRPLMTVWQDRGLLDEGQVHQTRRLLSGITSQWDFNAFHLDRLTGGHNLAFLCIHLFQVNGLIHYYQLDPLVVWKFFALVEKSYHATNPYHNAVHAADVTQAMSRFLEEPPLRSQLEPAEILGSIIAAVCHDLDHPGLNEKFLIATSSHLAGLYNNTSVLENHHWSMAVALMHESGLSASLSSQQHQELVEIIRSLILATDISRQQEFITQLRYLLDKDEVHLSQPRCRHFILQIALKCADISNPCRSWNISRLWSYRACEEFFRQGDKERDLNLPVTPFCDRQNISVAKVQSTFYRYVAAPLFEEWHRFLDSPLSTIMTRNLTSNQARWDLIVQQEGPSSMAESVISQTSTSSSSGGGSLHCDPPGGRDGYPPQFQRRFSRSSADDDDSDPCTSYPYMPLDDTADALLSRRHSLPYTITYYDEDLFPFGAQGGPLHRQFSLGDRRSRQAEMIAASAHYRAAHRRRVFAARVPQTPVCDSPSVDCSLNSSIDASDPMTDDANRVSFYIGGDVSSGHLSSLGSSKDPLSQTSRWGGHPNIVSGYKSASMDSPDPNLDGHHLHDGFHSKHHGRDDIGGSGCRDQSSKKVGICSFFRSSLDSSDPTSAPNCDVHRVSFHIRESDQKTVDNDFEKDKENCLHLGQRRGSAPSHLLLNQINRAAAKLASTASAVAASVSRESSPNCQESKLSNDLEWSHRRGSLPSNLIFAHQNNCQLSSTSHRGGPSIPCGKGCSTHEQMKKRKHGNSKNSGKKFGGSTDHLCEKVSSSLLNGGCNHPKRPLRRGSFRSSSFGGVGSRRGSASLESGCSTRPANENLPKKLNKKRNKNGIYVGPDEILFDIRNLSHLHLMKSAAKVSPSSQVFVKQSSFYNNGRRGSLPIEYITMSCRV